MNRRELLRRGLGLAVAAPALPALLEAVPVAEAAPAPAPVPPRPLVFKTPQDAVERWTMAATRAQVDFASGLQRSVVRQEWVDAFHRGHRS